MKNLFAILAILLYCTGISADEVKPAPAKKAAVQSKAKTPSEVSAFCALKGVTAAEKARLHCPAEKKKK